jgi:hypothetical protein
LFHLPKLHGSYFDVRMGRVTSRGKKTNEKMYPSAQGATSNRI